MAERHVLFQRAMLLEGGVKLSDCGIGCCLEYGAGGQLESISVLDCAS